MWRTVMETFRRWRADAVIDDLIAGNAPRVVWLGDKGQTLGRRKRLEFWRAEANLSRKVSA